MMLMLTNSVGTLIAVNPRHVTDLVEQKPQPDRKKRVQICLGDETAHMVVGYEVRELVSALHRAEINGNPEQPIWLPNEG